MTSKHLYFKLFKEDLKRKLWAAALLGLAFFFCLPVPTAMVLPSYKVTEQITLEQVLVRRLNNLRIMLGFDNGYPMVAVLLFVAAIVMGITTFSYLHNKKQIDFYHSLPAKRSLWFLVNSSTGIFLPAVIYLVAIVLSLIVGMVNGVFPGLVLGVAISGFLLNMLYYTLTYATVVLAMMLTGTKVAAVLGCVVFFGFFPMASLLVRCYYSVFLDTYYAGTPDILSITFFKLSPVVALNIAMNELNAARVLFVLAAIFLLGLFSFFLYQKRPSEAAGKTMAFTCSKGIVKVPLVLAFGTAGAMFFYSIQSSLGWTIFGNIVGVVLSHCIIEVIYWGDFKKVFCHEKTMAACLAVSLAVLLSFYFDMFNYDTYVPKESQVAYSSVDFNQDSWISSMNYDSYSDDSDVTSVLRQGKVEDTASVLALVNEAIRQMELEEQEGENSGKRLWKDYSLRCRLDVCYTLKSRRKVYRSYVFYMDPVLEAADKIYTDAVYKQALYSGLCLNEEAAENIVYRDWNDNIQHLEGTKEQRIAVLKAYQEEMTAISFSQRRKENPFANILLISTESIEEIEKKRQVSDDERVHYQWHWYEGYYYPIYPSFTKTIQALKDCGVEINELFTAEDVEYITISGYAPFAGGEEEEMQTEGITKSMSDEDVFCQTNYDELEDVKKILAALITDENGWRNGMAHVDNKYDIVVNLKGKGQRKVNGHFRVGEVPNFVVEDFKVLEEELMELDKKE